MSALDRSNLYAGKCCVCGLVVPSGSGYLVARAQLLPAVKLKKLAKWGTLCPSSTCAATAVGGEAVASAGKRELRADGTIVMPEDDDSRPLLRAIATWTGPAWVASPLYRDRDAVLRVAAQLQLEVSPKFSTYTDPPPIRLAVERAREAGGRDYQLEGVRWCAYRGTTYGAPPGFVDKKPGAMLCDDPGAGKTFQWLFGLHDAEGMLVICPANAKAVWPREVAKWRPERFDKITICEGSESFVWPTGPRHLVVINYDILPLSPAQIKAERTDLLRKRRGAQPNPRGKNKAERAGCEGLLSPAAAAGRDVADLRAEGLHTTAQRHELYLARVELSECASKLKLSARALVRNAKRKPCGKPPCKVYVCADESHYVANNKTRRTGAVRHLFKQVQRIITGTGTPVEDNPLKLWGLLQSSRCNPFSWTSFQEQFSAFQAAYSIDFRRHKKEGSTARGAVIVLPGTTEMLSLVLLRRTKAEVLPELPPKVFSEIPVPLTAKLLSMLDEITAANIDLLLAGGLPKFDQMSKVRRLLASASIPTMLREVASYEEAGIPLIVFSAHREPIQKLKGRKGWEVITGDVSARRRGEIEDLFQAGKLIGVAGTRAMAESMTLTYASTLLQVDPFWERMYNKQAEDRPHRPGQFDTVNIVRLVPDHALTRHAAELLSGKDRFVEDVLHGKHDYTPPSAPKLSPEDPAAWAERVAAKRAEDLAREHARDARDSRARERELAAIAQRDVTPKLSERRAQARAERLGEAAALHRNAPTRAVQDALAHMLAVCDGAVEKDDQGFNRPDGCVARWLAPGVQSGSEYAVASAAAILRHYPRQLAGSFPTLFSDAK